MSKATTYDVPGIHCAHCAETVTKKIAFLAGVDDVSVDVENKRVTVTGSDLDDQAVREAIHDAGYQAA